MEYNIVFLNTAEACDVDAVVYYKFNYFPAPHNCMLARLSKY